MYNSDNHQKEKTASFNFFSCLLKLHETARRLRDKTKLHSSKTPSNLSSLYIIDVPVPQDCMDKPSF